MVVRTVLPYFRVVQREGCDLIPWWIVVGLGKHQQSTLRQAIGGVRPVECRPDRRQFEVPDLELLHHLARLDPYHGETIDAVGHADVVLVQRDQIHDPSAERHLPQYPARDDIPRNDPFSAVSENRAARQCYTRIRIFLFRDKLA